MDDPQPDTPIEINEYVRVWLDSGGGVTIKAVMEPYGDPVEISAPEARRLAEALVKLADLDEQ